MLSCNKCVYRESFKNATIALNSQSRCKSCDFVKHANNIIYEI